MNQFINTINRHDYERFRNRVMHDCNISRATWSNWSAGKYKPLPVYRPIIDRIAIEMFGREVFGSIQSDRDTNS